jgi:hypothetical protein
MATRARLAFLAAAAAATLSMSGCFEEFIQGTEFIPDDPAVHRGGHDVGGSPGTAGASAGTRFTGRAEGQLASRITIRHGNVKSKSSWARFIGSYTSALEDSPLADAQWHGRFKTVRNRATGKFKIKGLVLSTFDDATAGRACLRLGYKGKRKQNRRPKKRGRGVFTMLGGEGGARTLYGKAIVRVKLTKANKMRFRGSVTQRQGAERGLTPACAKLERKFGLTPLPD